jgi:hypothetical protein
MNLVWVYNGDVKFDSHVGETTPERKIIHINYYVQSILSGKKYGYNTIMYCDVNSVDYFKEVVDEIVIVDPTNLSLLYDSFKIYVLENRDDSDYCIIDGDVILHNRLPEFTGDIMFDSYEVSNFKHTYKNTLQQLTDLNIKDELPMWENIQLPIISVGLLSIKNQELKKYFINNYNTFYNFISKHKEVLNLDFATAIGSQHLLAVSSKNYIRQPLSDVVGDDNPYYKHHCGPVKYYRPIVPTTYLINPKVKKGLL